VLLDVMLPFLDGFALVALLRAQPAWKNVPVIMLTAKTQEKDIVRALDEGANDYIVKPFQPAELLARIKRLSSRKA
jgi:DNA-binding response OmpR family regulator